MLRDIGAEIVFAGDVDQQLLGESPTWDRVAVAAKHGGRIAGWFAGEGAIVGDGRTWHQVRFNAFPSKRAFMAVVMDPSASPPSAIIARSPSPTPTR